MTTLLLAALSFLIQSTALLLLGLLALWLTRQRGPAVQTLIGRSTLAGVVLLLLLAPLTGQVRPLWRLTLPEPTPKQVSTLPKRAGEEVGVGASLTAPSGLTASSGLAAPSGLAGPSLATPAPISPVSAADKMGAVYEKSTASSAPTVFIPTSSPSRFGRVETCFGVGSYLAITALLLLWLAVCQWHLTRLRRTSTRLTSGPAANLLAELALHPPQLLMHPSVRSPFLAGLVQPAIYLPPTHAADFDTSALRAIFAHELAHLTRRDNAWTLASRLLCALLWPQPLLWVLCRRLEQVAEDACDAAVLAQSCPPHAYADCLLTLAERYPLPRHQRALGAGVAPYRSSLGRRVQRILTQGSHTMPPLTTRLRLTIAAVTLATVIGGVFLVSSAPAQTAGTSVSQTVVQGYIDALAAGQYDKAYRLLSPDGLTGLFTLPADNQRFDQFERGYNFSRPQPETPLFIAALAFFTDTHNTLKAAYHVIGPDPNHPGRILVAAAIPGVAKEQILALEVVGNTGQIDIAQSLHDTDMEAYLRFQDGSKRHTSLENLKKIALGLIQYAQGHDEHYPAAAHWMDAILPYVKDPSVFHDPFTPASQRYGYAINRACSNQSIAKFDYPASTVMVFTSSLGARNASDFGQSIRVSGHFRPGSAYAFADGHTKWYSPKIRPSFSLKGGDPIDTGSSVNAIPKVQAFANPNEQLSRARFLAGLTAVQGPGVIITLRDSKQSLPKAVPSMSPPNLIHDTDINQVVNELKAAGAEAISVNDQRLVATSSVRTVGPVIYVNNVPQIAPYTIEAIGSTSAILTVLQAPGSIATVIRSFDPAMFGVEESQMLTLPAYSGQTILQYAHPTAAAFNKQPGSARDRTASLIALTRKMDKQLGQVDSKRAKAKRAARERQATHMHLSAQKSVTPVKSQITTDQIKILDQEIAKAMDRIFNLEADGDAPGHPAVILAKKQLRELEQIRAVALKQP